MIQPGQIVLFRFPTTNLTPGKLRPALVIAKVPGTYNDWLLCMVSSQLDQQLLDFDDIILTSDPDFRQSGLKKNSIIRTGRLAIVAEDELLGSIGNIGNARLARIKSRLRNWLR